MMDFNSLTEEQKRAFAKAYEEEKKQKEERKAEAREEYKSLVDETVKRNFDKLKELSESLSKVKKEIFEDFETALQMKAELYGIKEKQQSHTFTSSDNKSITIGHRVVDNFDDTVHTGIEKVKSYISRATAGEKPELEEIINLLLKRDKNGNLKASRVIELERLASKIEDEELKDGVQIIKEAYKPVKSSYFIELSYKDDKGQKVYIPLAISTVEMK